jgi:uncharacterized membrane protein
MTDAGPRSPQFAPGHESEGKIPALIAWALFILSIPSANVLVLVGLVVSYAARGSATGVARAHLDSQIRLFWSVVLWTVLAWVAVGVGFLLTLTVVFAIIGIPLMIIAGLAWFLISVWFTVKSVLGLINLLGDRAP